MSESVRGAVIAPLPVAAVDFKPEISLAELPDDAARVHATHVLSKVQEHHVLRIQEELETCLRAALQSIEPSMLQLCESDLRHTWMLKLCSSLIECVVSSCVSETRAAVASTHVASPADTLGSEDMTSNVPVAAMFSSPRKRRRVQPAPQTGTLSHSTVD